MITESWALWLQVYLGAYVFPVDHPGLPKCAGWHKHGEPCDGKRGKHPACSWARDSTRSPDAIRGALRARLRNVGIDTRKSGLLIADEDMPEAFTKYASSINVVIPETFTVTTAKGRHFYFRQPAEPLGNGTGTLPDGIDIRGKGYVVAPGSVHETGVLYRPVDPAAPVAPIPDWLESVLRPAASSFRQSAGTGGRSAFRGSVPARLSGVLAFLLDSRPPVGNQPGNRNERLFWASCKVREMVAAGELDQAAAARVLTEAGESVGLGAGEVQATISSAMTGRVSA